MPRTSKVVFDYNAADRLLTGEREFLVSIGPYEFHTFEFLTLQARLRGQDFFINFKYGVRKRLSDCPGLAIFNYRLIFKQLINPSRRQISS